MQCHRTCWLFLGDKFSHNFVFDILSWGKSEYLLIKSFELRTPHLIRRRPTFILQLFFKWNKRLTTMQREAKNCCTLYSSTFLNWTLVVNQSCTIFIMSLAEDCIKTWKLRAQCTWSWISKDQLIQPICLNPKLSIKKAGTHVK